MLGLNEYRYFIDDLKSELSRLESILSGAGMSRSLCRPGCSACCLPFTLLPLEAYAIMSECEHTGLSARMPAGSRGRDCGFLTPDRRCAIYPVRPFLCRTRGFPILHMNQDGEWERDSCARRGFTLPSSESSGLHLENWNARLFHLNQVFCAERGIAPRRVRLSDLCAGSRVSATPA